MKITDLLSTSAIKINGSANSKEELISKMVDLMANNGNIVNKEEYKRVVLEREKEGTTGIGEGIAIPHGKTDAVSKPGLAAMVVPNGVDFDSLDGQPAKLIFLIVTCKRTFKLPSLHIVISDTFPGSGLRCCLSRGGSPARRR